MSEEPRNLGVVDTPLNFAAGGWLYVLVGLFGIIIGVVAAFTFRHSEKAQTHIPEQLPPALDEGIVRVLSVVRSAVIVLGFGDEVVRASAAAYALGVVREDALAHEQVREIVAEVRRSGDIIDEELELPRGPLGTGLVVLGIRVAHLTNDFLVVFADDRTEARRIEQVRQDFAVNVSHELKTPVGAISLLAETLEDAADDPVAVRQFAGQTRQEAKRLAQLVHDIIELSRLQAAGALIKVERVDVDQVIAEAIDRTRVLASATSHELISPQATGLVVYGDYDLLVTAVRNLLDNAVAYSPPNSQVSVAARVRDSLIDIAVLDQGIGLTPEQRVRIFERFYRADPARARNTGGTGLGLSIVKHVAQDHGGEVTVWSEPTHGSTFTLSIPRAVDAEPDNPMLQNETSEPHSRFTPEPKEN